MPLVVYNKKRAGDTRPGINTQYRKETTTMRRFVTKKVFRMIAVSLTIMVCLVSVSVLAANTYRKNAVEGDNDASGGQVEAVAEIKTEIIGQNCDPATAEAAAKEAAAAAEKAVAEVAKIAESGCGTPGTKPAEKPDATTPAETTKPTEKPAATTPSETTKPAETTQKPAETTPAETTKPAESTQAPSTGAYTVSAEEREVVRLVNEIRRSNGLSELTLNEELSRVARIKSEDMAKNSYFSHNSPTYGSPFDMMKKFGISYRTAGENIAKGQRSAQAVVDAWMNSEGHRANILNPSFTQIGVGFTSNGYIWTQMFIG
jgi:uncharacterized YkwD family protein